MAWAAIWQNGAKQPLDGFAAYRGAPDVYLDTLTLWLEIVMPARRRIPLRLWQGAAGGGGGVSVYLMPNGALRVLHGETLDIETEPGFLLSGQKLVLRVVLCARGRSDVIDALNA